MADVGHCSRTAAKFFCLNILLYFNIFPFPLTTEQLLGDFFAQTTVQCALLFVNFFYVPWPEQAANNQKNWNNWQAGRTGKPEWPENRNDQRGGKDLMCGNDRNKPCFSMLSAPIGDADRFLLCLSCSLQIIFPGFFLVLCLLPSGCWNPCRWRAPDAGWLIAGDAECCLFKHSEMQLS